MRREEIELAIKLNPGSVVELVLELQATVNHLKTKIEELEHRLNQTSKNSSKPPSSDRPLSRKARKILERERKKRSSRSAGGQPGHEGKTRQMAPAEDVNQHFEYLPESCNRCGESFTGSEEQVGSPLIHQKWELPEVEPLISEHRQLRLCCPNCGEAQLAKLPEGMTTSAFGPRLEAHIAVLAGVYRLSRRQSAQIVEEVFGIPISIGAVDSVLMRTSDLLADPYLKLQEAIRQAEVVHVDETSWLLKGHNQWLWTATTSLYACFLIDPSRGQKVAKELLGQDFGRVAVTDRYRGYLWLDALHRQLCWAHLIRQFVSLSERDGAPGRLGRKLVKEADKVFVLHRKHLEGEKSLKRLKQELQPVKEGIHELLDQGSRSRHKKTRRFCIDLLGDWDSLWLFTQNSDIPITNNAAERALRHSVIMRKLQFGTWSHKGSRWIERICSVRETCRLQDRSALNYLTEVADAAYSGKPPPSLVPP